MRAVQNFILLTLMVIGTSVVAQSPNPFVGTWTVTWEGVSKGRGAIQQSRDFEAELIIEPSGGSWKTFGATRGTDACAGKEVAVVIEKQTDNEIDLRLKFSEVASGCTDARVRLKRVDDKTLTGIRGKDTEVKATKK